MAKKYYYQPHQHLKEHLYAFLTAYNFAKRLKTLRGLTPNEYTYSTGTKSQNALPSIRAITPWD
jgi:hypothetical protein